MIVLANKITAKSIINRKCHFDRISMIDHDRSLSNFSHRYRLNRFNGISHAQPSLKYISGNTYTRNEDSMNSSCGIDAISTSLYSLTGMTYLQMR